MTEVKLGTKHTCFSCGAKFYDLGKSEALCPKCGADQKNAGSAEHAHAAQAVKRKRKPEVKAKPPGVRDDADALETGLPEADDATLDAEDLVELDEELDDDLGLGEEEVEVEDDED